MIKKHLKNRIQNKRVLILGFGREGKSSLKLLSSLDSAKEFGVADKADIDEYDISCFLKGKYDSDDISFHTGEDYLQSVFGYDIIMKSPGIVFDDDMIRKLDEAGIENLSQMQLFYEAERDRTIGITGTKGKSTTTTLAYHVLKEAGLNVSLGGNIGIPVFELIPDHDGNDNDDIGDDMYYVLEMSCHQLEFMSVSPKWGMLLNIYEEHLDHYGTFDKYEAAKRNIYVNQHRGDRLYIGEGFCKDDIPDGIDVDVIPYGKCPIDVPFSEIKLQGLHNLTDITFVYELTKDFGVSDEDFIRALKSYEPLPHRLQMIGEYNGIKWYDDSISTIDETTIQALETIKDTDVVIVGGMDRGIDYVNLEKYLLTVYPNKVILMDETGERILNEMEELKKDPKVVNDLSGMTVFYVNYMEEAVALAKEITRKGTSCVLSPAAASYNRFKNFEDRGDKFKEYVKA